jgi:aryl-alcohol dehydrogenase-like predicted oxidoreductase
MQQKLKRRPFGRTGLMVTELGFGAMNLRMLGSHEEARALVHHVLDQGSTCRNRPSLKGEIAPGVLLESERIVGEVLRARPHHPTAVFVTKGHAYTIPDFERDLATSLETLGVTGKGDECGSATPRSGWFI